MGTKTGHPRPSFPSQSFALLSVSRRLFWWMTLVPFRTRRRDELKTERNCEASRSKKPSEGSRWRGGRGTYAGENLHKVDTGRFRNHPILGAGRSDGRS